MFGRLGVFLRNSFLGDRCFQAMIVSFVKFSFSTGSQNVADIDQLTKIMSVVGTPKEDFWSKIQSEEARNYIK